MIYLDNNATTPVDPEVADAIFSSLRRDLGNPSSGHACGRKVKDVIEASRETVADFIGCRGDEIYFTSGGTESNNLALLGACLARGKGHIITSAIEHPSISNTCRHLESIGFEVTYVPCDESGILRIDELNKAIKSDTILISVMHSNNETGVLQPVEEAGETAKQHGIAFHVDAAQSIGKMHFSLNGSSMDMLTIVSHKFYGPKGIGALFVRNGVGLKPILYGAGHERGLRPGTENAAGIVGLSKACQIAKRDMRLRITHTTNLRDMLFKGLEASLDGAQLNGSKTHRLPNTLNIRIPGILSHELVETLKEKVAFSAGSACHSGSHTPSSVLKSMGLSDEAALSSIRLSIGKDNTEEEIKNAVGIIAEAAAKLRKS